MIIAVTAFVLPEPITPERGRDIFLSTAPTYQGVDGLVRKHYTLSEDGRTAGGVYLWESRTAAEALYTDAWRTFVRAKYGTDPTVTYFDSPVFVDNVVGQVVADGVGSAAAR
ncbi:monooxygenase [Cellulomonas fimi]|uniref:YdhR family protein n=1 Tax=Cellulomonas fimi TaxID=1708 RepID=A0A7Y0LZA7_CELFI|nr:monooxygenase [Cellulomonas fimi]NMR20661.1 YdhR family protein [Cellulomonas fimi]